MRYFGFIGLSTHKVLCSLVCKMGFRCDRLRVVAFFEPRFYLGFYSVSCFRLINDNAGGLRLAISSFRLNILLTLDDGVPRLLLEVFLYRRAHERFERGIKPEGFVPQLCHHHLDIYHLSRATPWRIKIQKNSTTSDINAWNPKIPPETRACFHEAKRAGMDCSIVLRAQFVSSNTQHSSI